ncbi:GPI-anchored cell wall organization protein Ecm33 [Lentithecium fluviatile CBS 122367]|uniref:GPI-anchored cell wall organization protein Ecm33 n=1 Tax=Lentithecium fluviatile CBS 122367 TaxID=1168545 RepID=A0A6G1JKX8_9PLEO|nr:GPI-anchored cell wall organization protein Ecm33 [Lentithecium fluviatile CBS 122367]
MSPLTRLALPALAVLGAVYAQTPTCSRDDTFTVQNSGDATSLGECDTYTGNVEISSDLTDDIILDGLQELKGDFVISGNSALQRISGNSLETITGKLQVDNVQNLASLAFPKLTELGQLTLQGLPNLRQLEFTSQVTKCPKIDIQNTDLQDLNGINVDKAESIFIANNKGIGNITMDVTNVTDFLTLSFNNEEVDVSFPKLLQSKNATFRACGSISLPALSKIAPGSLGVYDSKLESLACPNLTSIAQDLTLNTNSALANISFPELTKVGASLQIANNTQLHKIDGFPKLAEVGAALDMSGDLTEVSTPSIDFVKGVFNLQSTNDLGNTCDFYDKKKSDLGPSSKYVCKGKLDEARTAGGGTSGSSENKTGAAFPLHVQPTYLGLAGLAAVLLV